ncbi:MAG: RNA-binding S4 domain-containing protein [Lachnospiraceae bacterium]|nr:RNA-binding S4 domain-containing protein [Lachnospiraceae bacterium]
MLEMKIRDDFIKLGQAMKLADLVDSGVDAKLVIQDGQVSVNGEAEYQRGRKLRDGDVFEFDGTQVKVVSREA